MKILPFKKASLFYDNQKRRCFSESEIFCTSCFILKESKFSNKLFYSFLKLKRVASYFTSLRNKCLFSGSNRAVYSRTKMSRITFSKKVLSGSLTGVYRSIW